MAAIATTPKQTTIATRDKTGKKLKQEVLVLNDLDFDNDKDEVTRDAHRGFEPQTINR